MKTVLLDRLFLTWRFLVEIHWCVLTLLYVIFLLFSVEVSHTTFSLSLLFDSLVITCFGRLIFVLNVSGDLWVSCFWMLASVPPWVAFSATIFKIHFFCPFFFSFPVTPTMQEFDLLMVFHDTYNPFFLFYYFSFFSSDWKILSILVFQLTDSFFLVDCTVSIFYWFASWVIVILISRIICCWLFLFW